MSELKMGDRVRILNGGECKVLAKLGEGGQGIVYKVSYEGKEMALKWYFIEKMKNPKQFYSNLQRNIEQGAPTDSFLWPQELSEYSQGESFGYLMELRPQQYEDFQGFCLQGFVFQALPLLSMLDLIWWRALGLFITGGIVTRILMMVTFLSIHKAVMF